MRTTIALSNNVAPTKKMLLPAHEQRLYRTRSGREVRRAPNKKQPGEVTRPSEQPTYGNILNTSTRPSEATSIVISRHYPLPFQFKIILISKYHGELYPMPHLCCDFSDKYFDVRVNARRQPKSLQGLRGYSAALPTFLFMLV